jgi:uncharacterized protein (DUF305 family)
VHSSNDGRVVEWPQAVVHDARVAPLAQERGTSNNAHKFLTSPLLLEKRMRTSKLHIAVATTCLSFGIGANADDTAQHKHDQTMTASADSTRSHGSQDLHKAMMQGMQGMQGMKMSGNTDQDFASMMIQHHQQAIEMARVQLKDGKDPMVKKKAQEIIDASQRDIADLKKWQGQNQSDARASD